MPQGVAALELELLWSFSGAWSLEFGALNLHHRIFQRADAGDADANGIVRAQREIVRRNNARAGQEHRAVGETLAPEKISCQFLERTLDLPNRGFALENDLAGAPNCQFDFPFARLRFAGAHHDPRTDRAGAVVHLGLRKVEQVFPFDVTRTHVVPDGVADDSPAGIDDQNQFRLRHAPAGVFANADRVTRLDDFFRKRLEEYFRPFGL